MSTFGRVNQQEESIIQPQEGEWSGTFEGVSIRFTVRDGRVSNLKFTLPYSEIRGVYAEQGTITTEINGAYPVIEGQFRAGDVYGTFTSPTSAQGKASNTTTTTQYRRKELYWGGPTIPDFQTEQRTLSGRWTAGLGDKVATWDPAHSIESLNEIILKGDTAEALRLIRKNPRLARLQDEDGLTSLYVAAAYGQIDIAKALIEKGADVKRKCRGITSLHLAVASGKPEMVTLIMEQGGDINAEDVDGETPLTYALLKGYDHIVSLLRQRGARISLLDAVLIGDANLVKTSLKTLPQPNQSILDKCLVQAPNRLIAEILVERGADINREGRSCLARAAEKGHLEVVDFLIARGIQVNTGNDVGDYYAPLQAAAKGGHVTVVELLLSKGANINADNVYTSTAFAHSSRSWSYFCRGAAIIKRRRHPR